MKQNFGKSFGESGDIHRRVIWITETPVPGRRSVIIANRCRKEAPYAKFTGRKIVRS